MNEDEDDEFPQETFPYFLKSAFQIFGLGEITGKYQGFEFNKPKKKEMCLALHLLFKKKK